LNLACQLNRERQDNVPHTDKSLSSTQAPVDQASALAPGAAEGHFDELRGLQSPAPAQSQSQSQTQSLGQLSGQTQSPGSPGSLLAPAWTTFFNFLGHHGLQDLNQRSANLRRQIRDNGVTYNVYADANGPQRPWSLDLFPLIISPDDWAGIESGIKQRTRLLNHIMTDVYGPQNLLKQGLLPAALVQGHPGYLRAMQGVLPAGGMFLHIAAFDIARGPDGKWWVVSQRTQAPSGLGYLLENRLSISMQFSEAFQGMQVQRLAESYKALVDSMKTLSAVAGSPNNARVVLLTPGPYNETYFEHAYLARYLGLTLVEGSDLMVRGERLYLKTLQGLEPVHGLLKRMDDEFLDPLELRADSTLGVPGLLQVIRAGNVQVANAPGSAFLESSAILGFLPALSEHLLGETLRLPSLSTWWCGEHAVMQDMLPQLRNSVIKPTYPGTGMESVIGHTLSQHALDEWAGRILRHGEDYTVQAYLPLSQAPTWQGEKIVRRSAMLRVFALPDGQGAWRVLPGGLARLAGMAQNIASMQHGGSSADVWALGRPAKADPPFAPTVTPHAEPAPGSISTPPPARAGARKQPVTSRAAENLFWLGRYTERSENSLRLAQLTLQGLVGADQSSRPLLDWLTDMAVGNALVLKSAPRASQTAQARRVFERALIAGLADTETQASLGYNLRCLKHAASAVRERLSQEQWHVIVQMEQDFFRRCDALAPAEATAQDYSPLEALRTLDSTSNYLAAITGAQTDRMMRDDGWQLLSIGRHIERLGTLSSAMALGFETGAVFDDHGYAAIVAMFDSTISFHAQYQQRRDLDALLDLLVLSQDNPRSLSWVIKSLKSRLLKLPGNDLTLENSLAAKLPELASMLVNASHSLASAELTAGFDACRADAFAMSNQVSQRYFSHASSSSRSLNA
jgi:uncharacterized circularly permuted ATP-grasp superfamily protein/uncharacterized alpha-E superfamily protein